MASIVMQKMDSSFNYITHMDIIDKSPKQLKITLKAIL